MHLYHIILTYDMIISRNRVLVSQSLYLQGISNAQKHDKNDKN